MTDADATLLRDATGRPVLRFERVLSHPVERVWRALTEPRELTPWHPTPFELEPAAGGVVSYVTGRWPAMSAGEVVEYDPPRVLAHTWDSDVLRWELQPRERGCLLVLTHTFDDRLKAARDGAGWHLCLDALRASLDGTQMSDTEHADRIPAGWSELNEEYQRRFGINAAEATPPPARQA